LAIRSCLPAPKTLQINRHLPLLHINGHATIGEMVTFMNFAGLIVSRLEQSVTFINRVMMEAPRLREFF
jgi:hypothetical protein